MHHVARFREPLECYWTITIDWGGVRDKTVALLHTHDYNNDTDLVYDELIWGANTPSSEILAGLRKWEENRVIHARWGDIPGQLQVDLQQAGYQIAQPQKSEWRSSINAVSVLFSNRKIKIHERCKFLQKSCRAGMFNKQNTDFDRTIELGHCDALAALMYGVRMQDRSNPYTQIRHDPSTVFTLPQKDEGLDEFTKGFGKRFGSFK